MNAAFVRMNSLRASALLLALAANIAAAGTPAVQAVLHSANERKSAPDFALKDASGRTVALKTYRGQVVLLDFWATECGGCVREIPSFMDLARAYKKEGLAVAGISMDISYENLKDSKEAWSRVKPFVQAHKVNYPILMGGDQEIKSYGIQALPLTYLIDQRGRIAATYGGVADKDNMEANIRILLKERNKSKH